MEIDFTDITYSVQMGVMWTVIEPELAIICANMPLLKTVLSRMAPGLFSTGRATKYGVSDPQTFERLQDQQSSNIYPMNQMDHQAVRTHISSTNTNESQRDLYGKGVLPSVTSESVEDLYPHGKHVRKDSPPGRINVTQNFVVQYRS